MPLEKKVRPSSALGKLETLHVPRPVGNSKDGNQQPEWLARELLKQNRRRHSVTLGDKAHLTTRPLLKADLTHSPGSLKTDQVSLEDLQKLKRAFEEFEMGGLRSMDEKNFGCIVKKCLNLHNTSNTQIQELFKKIDYSGQGRISWDEFCTYMQLEYRATEECVARSKQAAFTLPATIKTVCHGVPVAKIHSTPDDTILTVQEDGSVCCWSPGLQLQKTKSVFHERPATRSSKWATDFIPMIQYSKLIIATGDREIQMYELSSLEPYCQITALETLPLTLDCCDTGPDECAIVYGDDQGCVNIILMSSAGQILRLWHKLPKTENMPSIGIDQAVLSPDVTYIRWKVHQDWVTQAKYFHNINAVVSTSDDEASAVVIGCVLPSTNIEQQLREITEACCEGKDKKVQPNWTPQPRASYDQTVFTVYKGVKTFDLCKRHNLLVTGGMDRLVRMWNPYCPGKPTGVLKGHSAPIFYLCISSEDNRLFPVSMDCTVKIWHIRDQSCLFTANTRASGIDGDISACFYSPSVKSLYIAADYMALLPLKIRPQLHRHVIVSHNEPVMCCGYSEELRQVVSCTEGSVVKVWDFDTGHQVFEFGGAHGPSTVTCMTFDPKGRRLITGGQDGCLKIWNFNNGRCLKTLKRDAECRKVCDCTYLKVHRNPYVVSVGWDRKIDIYSDTPEDPHHVQRLQAAWQDDLRKDHKDDMLCIAQCPPSLLATGSHDGEIIVWNVVSGHTQCRFHSPLPPEYQNVQGVDKSVPCIIFLRISTVRGGSSSITALLSAGAGGSINFWNVLRGGQFVSSFEASRFQQKITRLAKTQGDARLYVADQIGYIYIYNMEEFAFGPEQKPPRAGKYWRAHTSRITGLQIVDNDQVVLTSSTDCTVRLWSAHGEFIGTFGQSEPWNVYISSSWKHPAVPYEILIDPLSLPVHEILNGNTCVSNAISPDKEAEADGEELKPESHSNLQHPAPSISNTDVDEEIKNMQYPEEHEKWLCHEIIKHSAKLMNHSGLECFDIVEPPNICVRSDPSLAGIDRFRCSTEKLESTE
ncbi:WD repeat-containing protein on Y chromosome [Myripristis murdjan]|uniref:WD repeat-containing protein on Y chromosome n=1 Tax=Myripristis murdjan TaxID=586833 RepID=UPI0011760859|nr:WD repeat-containing protein on Y chromosome-like [Myripristis murdjan]